MEKNNDPSIFYILSSTFCYNEMICDDAGPGFAQNMGWKQLSFNALQDKPLGHKTVLIFDARIPMFELERLLPLIKLNPSTFFFFSVIDPEPPETINGKSPYYSFLKDIASLNNTGIVSKYQPEGQIQFLFQIYGANRFLHLPFPYNSEKEKPLKIKKNKIIFSGNISLRNYPERHFFWRRTTRSISRIWIDILPHPGYSKFNIKNPIPLIFENYISHLSNYWFCFVSSSKFKVELLKYGECAYAGCVPVGTPPIQSDISWEEFIIPLERPSMKNIFKLILMPRIKREQIIKKYRNTLNRNRNPNVLNQRLLKFVDQFPIFLPPKIQKV